MDAMLLRLREELGREIAGLREDRLAALAGDDRESASLAEEALGSLRRAALRAGEAGIEDAAAEALAATPGVPSAAIREGWR